MSRNNNDYSGVHQIPNFLRDLKGEPDWLSAIRQKAWERFEAMQWPDSSSEEEWRRSPVDHPLLDGTAFSLPQLSGQALQAAEAGQQALDTADAELAGPAIPLQQLTGYLAYNMSEAVMCAKDSSCQGMMVFTLDDICRGTVPDDIQLEIADFMLARLDSADNRFIPWNMAIMNTITVIVAEKDTICEKPFLIDYLINGANTVFSPVTIVIQKMGSQLSVLERFRSFNDLDSTLVNRGLIGSTANQSRLFLNLVQETGSECRYFSFASISCRRDSFVSQFEGHFGAGFAKGRVEAVMHDVNGEASVNGAYFGTDEQHYDFRTVQRHLSGNASSQALYRGVVKDSARTLHQGLIAVEEGASRTDAYLTNNNLVLNDGARADSIPTLEIKHDDVKCSHGSTTGSLNPAHLFYLLTRGFSVAEAQALLIEGFLLEPAVDLPVCVQQHVKLLVAEKLQGSAEV
ncbi:MAG: hypothetical protein D6B26_04545 [Spirochaetaceae bacterium]|nr:MAG: hypothetical protein D6B26_04545 [Spirochaetaceae bacterium]